MPEHMTVKEAAEYLGVCPRTIYNLVGNKRLDAVKTPGGLRIKTASVVAFKNRMRRIKYPGRVFTFPIIDQYRYESEKYRVITKDKGAVGWISLRPEYLKGLSKKELARQYFKPIKYHRVRLEGGYAIIVVSEQDFDRLPRAEKSKWLRFKMKPERIREEIER